MKRKLKNAIVVIFYLTIFWMSISNIIQAIKCPEMTQTELLLHLPKSFIGNWNNCK